MTLSASAAAALLRSADPVSGTGTSFDERAESDLRRIVASPRLDAAGPEAARRPKSRLLPAAVWTAAIALVGVALGGLLLRPAGDAAHAATPDRLVVVASVAAAGLPADGDAESVLNAIATRAAVLPDDTGSGRYARMDSESWALWTRVDGERVTSEVVPVRTTVWTAADGSGRLVSRRDGPGRDADSTDKTLAAGERHFMWPLGSLSTDEAELAHQLEESHPVGNGPAERLVAVTDLVREQPLAPQVRAAVLRYLARTPGLTVDGIVTDRAGRRGLAVHLDTTMSGLPERRTLIIDPDDGRVLGAETLLTKSAGALEVSVPSVISYTTFRSARYTDDLK